MMSPISAEIRATIISRIHHLQAVLTTWACMQALRTLPESLQQLPHSLAVQSSCLHPPLQMGATMHSLLILQEPLWHRELNNGFAGDSLSLYVLEAPVGPMWVDLCPSTNAHQGEKEMEKCTEFYRKPDHLHTLLWPVANCPGAHIWPQSGGECCRGCSLKFLPPLLHHAKSYSLFHPSIPASIHSHNKLSEHQIWCWPQPRSWR